MFLKKLLPELQKSTSTAELMQATNFQKKMVACIKSGADLIAQAPANAGKTTALLIGLLHVLKQEVGDTPRALWLTRDDSDIEMVMELYSRLGTELSLRMVAAPNRGDIFKQKDEIYIGSDIVVTTPRRASDLLSIEGINMISMRHLILHRGEKLLRNEVLTLCYRVTESLPKAQLLLATEEIKLSQERYKGQFMAKVLTIKSDESFPKKNPEIL